MANNDRARTALDQKRERFDEAGRFPVRKVLIIGVLATLVIVGSFVGYQRWDSSRQVGGATVATDVQYPAGTTEMVELKGVTQTAEGVLFSLVDVKENAIVSLEYQRTQPMPADLQEVTGGNLLPLMSYISPNGRLVVATSLCEPCRSTKFHIEQDSLTCDVCFTRWDLDTLAGIAGGCVDYPPEEVQAEVSGDVVFIPAADLEGWKPRAF
ncbi:MAG: Fe-S-containing protein [Thermoleophilia bacterium]